MKKGFTLVEILAVIIVLGIVSLIAVPRVLNIIEESRTDKLYAQKLIAKRAAKEYVLTLPGLTGDVGNTVFISVDELIENNRITETLDVDGYFAFTKVDEGSYDVFSHISIDGISPEDNRLLGHYPLIGNAVDYSGRANNGEVMGNPEIIEGILGEGYRFQTNSHFVRIPHEDYVSERVFGVSANHSLMAFVYVENYENWATVINKATGGSWSNTTSGIWVSDQGGITFSLASNEGGNPSGSNSQLHYTNVETDKWYHVVGVADGSRQYLYLNGELVADRSISISRTRSENTQPITLGRRSVGSNPSLRGMIQDVRIYDRVLSSDEIKFIYDMAIRSIESND